MNPGWLILPMVDALIIWRYLRWRHDRRVNRAVHHLTDRYKGTRT